MTGTEQIWNFHEAATGKEFICDANCKLLSGGVINRTETSYEPKLCAKQLQTDLKLCAKQLQMYTELTCRQ